jgi:hypothetical protein
MRCPLRLLWKGSPAVLLLLCACQQEKEAAPRPLETPEATAFIEAFRKAHRQEDPAALLALYHLEGVPADERERLKTGLAFDTENPVARARLYRLSQDELTRALAQELPARSPNLEPVARLVVDYDVPERLHSEFLVGQLEDGRYRIVYFLRE